MTDTHMANFHDNSTVDCAAPRKTWDAVLKDFDLPWYVIDTERCAIRVYHGDLDKSWWTRGMAHGERQVKRVEEILREATGLQRVTRHHDWQVVEFRLRKELFDRAAVALRMSMKCLAESDEVIRRVVERRVKEAG